MSYTKTAEDLKFEQIFKTNHVIAVVGISDKPYRAGYYVPAYLQEKGYQIIPVNPTLDRVLGQKAYADLLSVPDRVDVVLIFRKNEFIPPIVEQAIQIKARVVWMQLGIINETAAELARKAGLEVVMDQCMLSVHQRLFSR
ncbi:MAG: CoA-binding protein [Omnitrophica WOR_2 bacterium]